MSGLTRGPRRTDHAYDKTDLILLGGGAVLVLIGLALAADSWFAPRGDEPAPSSGLVASADSARRRFLRRDSASGARDSAATPAATADSAAAIPAFTPAAAPAPVATVPVATAPATTAPVAAATAATAPVASAPVPTATTPAATPPATPASSATKPTAPAPTAPAATAATAPAGATAAPRRALTSAVAGEPGSWSVQAGAFGSRENADRLAASIGNLGFRTTVVQTGALHRVRAIGFPSQAAADSAKARIATVAGSTLVVLPPAP